ncbi:MAG: GerMN domain-containing protein [Spirochaetia bacterium]|jgi:spore germination protein GerM|nr:GerMN domain-containing protein [Spirochaetales bacterium]MDX9783729.1 GerMN domain-containing protein [Spirochaetia bacterium]
MAVKKKRKKSSNGSPGCLILLVGLIILAIVFVIKLPDIKRILEKTEFLELVRENSAKQKEEAPPATDATGSTLPREADKKSGDGKSAIPPSTEDVSGDASGGERADQPLSSVTTVAPATRESSLYFVRIGDDGQISRHEVKRRIPVSDSPLTDAVKALLAGPSEGEIRSGLVSLIPRGTTLLGIVMRGNTAFIDLSEAFMYNHYGSEGFIAQLRQIVFTATSFSSVQDVQIVIEGQKKDYLGGEGVYIGKPLSRASL